MRELYKVLKKAQKTPQVYFGRPSIGRLYAFVSGYIFCQYDSGVASIAQDAGFQEFIQAFYGIELTQNWENIIRFFSVDERDAFDTFYVRLDEYMNEQKKKNMQGYEEKKPIYNEEKGGEALREEEALCEILKRIRKRPQLYLGSVSLEKLYAFIKGYAYCLYEKDEEYFVEQDAGFQKYIQEFYGIKSTQNWERIIQFYANDEEEAFKLFYTRLEEYLEKGGRI